MAMETEPRLDAGPARGPCPRGKGRAAPCTLALVVGLSPILGHLHTPLPGQESVARLCLERGRQFRGWVSAGGRVSQQRGGVGKPVSRMVKQRD